MFCHLIRDPVSNLDKISCIIPADAESPNSLPFHFRKLIHHLVHQVNGSTPSLCLITNLVLYPLVFWYLLMIIFFFFLVKQKMSKESRLVWLFYLSVIIITPYLLPGKTPYSHFVRNHLLSSLLLYFMSCFL